MAKKYYLLETKTIAEFDNKEEAEATRDNFEVMYPENNYQVVEETEEE
ncbi:MAG: hypothetical protein ACTSR2_00805 [Candidatus Hodarchaeales archaeon]